MSSELQGLSRWLIVLSVISMFTAIATCALRFGIPTIRRSRTAFAADMMIGLAAAIGLGGVLFAICEAVWWEDAEALQKFGYLGQALLILGTALSRVSIALTAWTLCPVYTRNILINPWVYVLAISAALALLNAAISYAALVQCSASWDKPLVGSSLGDCWSQHLSVALSTAQLGLDIVNLTTMSVLFVCLKEIRNRLSAFAILSGQFAITFFTICFKILELSRIRSGIPSRELDFMMLFVGEQNLTIIAANILPIIKAVETEQLVGRPRRRARPARAGNASIPLQNLRPAHRNSSRAAPLDSSGRTFTVTVSRRPDSDAR
ncbi:hypothetical protein F4820DRAFT_453562 [Hypoxylon rubiginosum]|uniref:Uncharacterized protein n=1 Tax=Hypoxylon rubiginosum TaxID=110542 RepID=A0ACB9YK31_9PEZI|nr:hypothetical protein F4820DRAFT_453562 [Hypoxylon rubiginosum]